MRFYTVHNVRRCGPRLFRTVGNACTTNSHRTLRCDALWTLFSIILPSGAVRCGSSFLRILRCGAVRIIIFENPTVRCGAVLLNAKSDGAVRCGAVKPHRSAPHGKKTPHLETPLKRKNAVACCCIYLVCTNGLVQDERQKCSQSRKFTPFWGD